MKDYENISKKQIICITSSFLIGPSLIVLTGLKYAKKDIIICEILGLTLGLILNFAMIYIVDKFPNVEFTQILNKLFKTIFGKIIASIYLYYSICLICLVETNVVTLIKNMVMPKTPSWIIIITITLVIAYILNKGIEPFSLNAEILFPFIIFSLAFIYVALILKYADIKNLFPIFTENIANITRGTIDVFSFPFVDSSILIFVYSLSKDTKKNSIINISFLLTIPFLILRSVIVISILSLDESIRHIFPLFEVVRLIQIGSYFERLELILLISWIFTSYIKLTICYYVILKCIEYIFDLNDYKKLSCALVILITPLSINTFSGIEDSLINSFISMPVMKIPVLLTTGLIFFKTLTHPQK